MSASADGTESVDQFLARIAATPQSTDETTKRMDDDFIKARQERQQRRLERARSISPSKTGPTRLTPAYSSQEQPSTSAAESVLKPPIELTPKPATTISRSNAVPGFSSGRTSTSPSRPLTVESDTDAARPSTPTANISATSLARSGTLSWQQRPASRDGPRQRPISVMSSAKTTPSAPTDSDSSPVRSRTDIAASLAQKDPAWFRQTQDRGLGSSAYRKSQVEDTPEPPSAKSRQLPGMSQSREPSKSPAPMLEEQEMGKKPEISRFSRGTTPDIVAMRNSMIEKPAHLRPTSSDLGPSVTQNAAQDSGDPSNPQNVMSPPRSASPTKGLGGFVESAMMRRSDSVSKRWSVKAGPGLRRGDSVLGSRPQSLHARGMSHDLSVPRGGSPSSPLPSPRPTSSHGQGQELGAHLELKEGLDNNNTEVSPTDRGRENQPAAARPQTPTREESNLARSPSRASSPRKWSPTKSTWLESALQQKQEPPKMLPFQEEQPKWKVDLQRSKSLRSARDASPDKNKAIANSEQTTTNAVTSPTEPVKSDIEPSKPAFPGWASSQQKKDPTLQSSPQITSTSNVQSGSLTSDKSPDAVEKQIGPSKLDAETGGEGPDTKSASAPLKTVTSAAATPEPVKSPPALRPKPSDSTKLDSHPLLKSRTQEPAKDKQVEPEFKSMFGKLKRTTTQNYVAPDVLKDNILSGKAALNITGGPVKTKRVDEFKESILAKKEEMKNAPTSTQLRPEIKPKPEAVVPEALARRKTLSKASAPTHLAAATKSEQKPPSTGSKPLLTQPKEATSGSVDLSKTADASDGIKTTLVTRPKPADIAATSIADNKTKPAPTFTPKQTISQSRTLPDLSQAKPAEVTRTVASKSSTLPSPPTTSVVGRAAGGSLASRINPNLAAMLSRGGSPKLPESNNASKENLATNDADSGASNQNKEAANLTHITKARAKGPKRRAPKTEASVAPAASLPKVSSPKSDIGPASSSNIRETGKADAERQALSGSFRTPNQSQSPFSSKTGISSSPSPAPAKPFLSSSSSSSPRPLPKPSVEKTEPTKSSQAEEPLPQTPKSKPAVATKSPDLRRTSGNLSVKNALSPQSKQSTPVSRSDFQKSPSVGISEGVDGTPSKSSKPLIADKSPLIGKVSKPVAPVQDEVQKSPKPVTPRKPSWTPNPIVKESVSPVTKAKSETTPLGPREKNIPTNKPAIQGLGFKTTPSPQQVTSTQKARTLTPPPEPVANTNDGDDHIRNAIQNYVGTISKENERTDFDTQQFLVQNKESIPKLETTYRAIAEITGDGRKTSMPAQQEHILYEDSMYLIAHTFNIPSGATTSEVHLWCGNRVADASVEDAQVFCRRDARDHNTKLEILKQGKETTSFLQAMGGILIVRRNKTSHSYMLCGRRHLGHIVFDEVDCDAKSLCPGFAYLVSGGDKLYLWKGKGAGADEVGSARLIGMDLAANSGFVEIDQGSEPAAFWTAVGGKSPMTWQADWEKRGSMNCFPTALYRVEHERPGMLTNLASWGLKRGTSPAKAPTKAICQKIPSATQSDLDQPAIHILDAYRTLYVILTRQCAGKAAEFVTALYLAQDIAMLSPAIQDRPVLPACYVVAGDIGDDIKACFRNWSAVEAASMAGKDSVLVRLEDALEALEL